MTSHLARLLWVSLVASAAAASGCANKPGQQPEPAADVRPTLESYFYDRLRGPGFVPDEQTAIAIARAVWAAAYPGSDPPADGRYVAELDDGVWSVRGTLPDDPNLVGGVPHAKIARSDGRILDLYHTQ